MQTYEDLEAKYGTEETPESILLLVQIPDGLFGFLLLSFYNKQHQVFISPMARLFYKIYQVLIFFSRKFDINSSW